MAQILGSTDTNVSPVTARYSICYLQPAPTTSGILNIFRRDLLSALVRYAHYPFLFPLLYR